jgi:transposase
LVLYDLSSTYFEGRTCPLARYGHSRDSRPDRLQIVFGLLTDAHGVPVAVEVFAGNTGDPTTVAPQIEKLRQRFGLRRLVLVGDRGMLTEARLREDVRPLEGLSWITALRAPDIQQLATSGSLQMSLFDQQDLAEITDPAFPGERLVVCRNPLLTVERARKRQELLAATEKHLNQVQQATRRTRQPLRGKDAIGLRVGKLLGRFKMAKHFQLTITDDSFSYQRHQAAIDREASLDGIYVLRTDLPEAELDTAQVVETYKGLANVERAFRSIKTTDLKIRPIYHRLADRVRAHVLLCMLAYYVELHLRRRLAPLLFDDEDPQAARALRSSPVAPARRSPSAQAKALTKTTPDGLPVHSFQGLLRALATLTKNQLRPKNTNAPAFHLFALPTPLQQRAFQLLGIPYTM